MIRKRAELDTVNPPGQIVHARKCPANGGQCFCTGQCMQTEEEWKRYEQSRNERDKYLREYIKRIENRDI